MAKRAYRNLTCSWLQNCKDRFLVDYSKTCLKQLSGHSKEDQTLVYMVFKTDFRLMKVKSIAECSKSILQYFRPSFSYHLPVKINNKMCRNGTLTKVWILWSSLIWETHYLLKRLLEHNGRRVRRVRRQSMRLLS